MYLGSSYLYPDLCRDPALDDLVSRPVRGRPSPASAVGTGVAVAARPPVPGLLHLRIVRDKGTDRNTVSILQRGHVRTL